MDELRIVEVKATPVTVPMEAPLRWSMGVEKGTTRTIIEVVTDRGVKGTGETYGGAGTLAGVEAAKPFLLGADPFEIERLARRFQAFRITYEYHIPPYVWAGIEMALWDLVGKVLDRPLYSLLGGCERRTIPFAAYLFYRYRGEEGVGGESSPEDLFRYYEGLVDRYGNFPAVKIKGGVYPPEEELAAVARFRESLGPRVAIRFDPNAAWSVETSIRVLRQMEEYDPEFVEDPTWGIEGMALVRRDVGVPLATNMCVIDFDQVPLAVRRRAIDVVALDPHYWGGILACKRLLAVAETFRWGVFVHSDRELGVSTAAILHIMAAHPYITHPADSHYHHQVGDVIREEFTYQQGHIRVPEGPGLGVELDPDRLKQYHRLYQEWGDLSEFYDPYRPEWVPHLPLW